MFLRPTALIKFYSLHFITPCIVGFSPLNLYHCQFSNLNISWLFFRQLLDRSLRYCEITVELLKQAGIEMVFHGKEKNEAAHYCSTCEVWIIGLILELSKVLPQMTFHTSFIIFLQYLARKLKWTTIEDQGDCIFESSFVFLLKLNLSLENPLSVSLNILCY